MILESVLYREVGDAVTMGDQIQHLLAVGDLPSVMLQVVADTTAVAGALGGAFAIATEGMADVAAYAESNIQGAVYTDPDLVARAARVFDGLRADALPWTQTQDLLRKSRRTMDALNWRKASYSASNGGGCVEVADHASRVLVRDTQDRTGPVLRFTPEAWRRFADLVKRA